MKPERPTLFECKRTSRRLTRQERAAAYKVLRYVLKPDQPQPGGEALVLAFDAMQKLKPLRRMKP